MTPVRFDPEARLEFLAAADWYAERNPGVSHRFVAAVQRALELVRGEPRAFPLASDVPPRLGVRRTRLEQFPYSVVFVELEHDIRVLAVAHGRRRPGYWRKRL